jgi:hypothetical protein
MLSKFASLSLTLAGHSFLAFLVIGISDQIIPTIVVSAFPRYGWVPKQYKYPDEPQFEWLKTFPSGYSITHLEMEYGALQDRAKNARAAFYLRDPVCPLH